MAHNVPAVYDVLPGFAQQRPGPAKCAGMRRGRRSRPSRMEAKPATVGACLLQAGSVNRPVMCRKIPPWRGACVGLFMVPIFYP
jgi:hypothetical protein